MTSKVTIKSLQPNDKEGYMVKQGGSVKTWKKRWFILKGTALYYFKTNKPDQEEQGTIDLTATSFVKQEEKRGKKHAFSVGTTKRVFYMYAENEQDSLSWIKAIGATIDRIKSGAGASLGTGTTPTISNPSTPTVGTTPTTQSNIQSSTRDRISKAKGKIPFLNGTDGKLNDFWAIWFTSIPTLQDVGEGAIDYEVVISSDLQKLSWRAHGPQHVIIQKMVDFFWNVGAPEIEIDRLNDVGALVNPMTIGSWIDMSSQGGMDGGWYFPVNVPIKFAIESSDSGVAIDTLAQWAQKHDINTCYSIARDMGAAPPRQNELMFKIFGETLEKQLEVVLSAFSSFEIPTPPEDMLEALKVCGSGLNLSVVSTSEGIVKIGVLFPYPSEETIAKLSTLGGKEETPTFLKEFSNELGTTPSYVELQYFVPKFGYGVYTDGFDILYHYHVGKDEKK